MYRDQKILGQKFQGADRFLLLLLVLLQAYKHLKPGFADGGQSEAACNMELHKGKLKIYRIAQVLMWPWCLYRLTGGWSGTFCRSACQRERGIFITLQLSRTQCALPGTKFSSVLGHNRESATSRWKEVVLPLYSALGSPSLDTASSFGLPRT